MSLREYILMPKTGRKRGLPETEVNLRPPIFNSMAGMLSKWQILETSALRQCCS